VVVLAWDNLDLTRRCVESLRSGTDVPNELIIVDNGSEPDGVRFAEQAADVAILNEENRGFAVGMNQGLEAARGRFVAFINNDTVFPGAWASRLIETLERDEQAGIVVPAVTQAGNPSTVRQKTGTEVLTTRPFRDLPSGVVYLVRTRMIRTLGGWNERYPIASSEDLDLLFTVWVSGLEVLLDERVLVDHVGSATAGTRIRGRDALSRANRRLFVDRWADIRQVDVPIVGDAPSALRAARFEQARIAAMWMRRAFKAEDELARLRAEARHVAAAQPPTQPATTEAPPVENPRRLTALIPARVRRAFRSSPRSAFEPHPSDRSGPESPSAD
jgi:GT2 family glycosyltransferase